jgi:hypothetical protein
LWKKQNGGKKLFAFSVFFFINPANILPPRIFYSPLRVLRTFATLLYTVAFQIGLYGIIFVAQNQYIQIPDLESNYFFFLIGILLLKVGEVPVVENENLYLGVSRDRSQILLDE